MMTLRNCSHGIDCSCSASSLQLSSMGDCSSSSRTVEQQLQRLRQRQLLLQQQQQQQQQQTCGMFMGKYHSSVMCINTQQSLDNMDLLRRNSQPINILNTGSVTKSQSFPLNAEVNLASSPSYSPSSSPSSSLVSGPSPAGRQSSGPCSRSRHNTPDGGTLMSLVTRWRADRSSRAGGETDSIRSGAGSPSLSVRSSNSRESLNGDLSALSDKSDSQSRTSIRVYMEDQRYYSLPIDVDTTVAEVLDHIIEKSLAKHDPSWAIVEHLYQNSIERSLEEHELIYNIYSAWPSKSGNKFYLRKDFNKYELFRNPNQYFPESMTSIELPKDDSTGILTRYERYKNLLLQNLLRDEIIPDIQGYLHIKEGKRSWKKYFCVLRQSGLYYSSKGNSKDSRYLNLISPLYDVNIYMAQHAKKTLGAPTSYGFCLKQSSGIEQNGKSCKMFSCDTEQARLCWVTAIRFIKYGSKLRENYKLMLKCDERLKELQTKMNGLLTENGLSTGQQICDPKGSPSGYEHPMNFCADAPMEAVQRVSPVVTNHLVQPWFHSGLTREDAELFIRQQGLIDGVFLLRDSQSMPGLTVLTFAHESKVKHCKIIKETDSNDHSFYSLDGGVTRFLDLSQLVDFYQLNSGALPTRLSYYVAKSS